MKLENRMKLYEKQESGRRLMPLLPILARLDGRCFHNFTQSMERPYDIHFSELMQTTTEWLVQETQAKIGYTQSDEITLLFYSNDIKSQVFFDGRIAKLVSTLAAMTTLFFYNKIFTFFDEEDWDNLEQIQPTFDCRVWNVPTKAEAVNVFIWREQDATRNSVQIAAQHYYSHKELLGKNNSQMQDMLYAKGINWNDYPIFFKRGTYFQQYIKTEKFISEELSTLPPEHHAHQDPNLEFKRHSIRELEMKSLSQILNPIQVVFEGKLPKE